MSAVYSTIIWRHANQMFNTLVRNLKVGRGILTVQSLTFLCNTQRNLLCILNNYFLCFCFLTILAVYCLSMNSFSFLNILESHWINLLQQYSFTLKPSLATRALKYLISCKHVLEWLSFFWKLRSCFYALIVEALIAGKGTSNSSALKVRRLHAKSCLCCSCCILFPLLHGKEEMETLGCLFSAPWKGQVSHYSRQLMICS